MSTITFILTFMVIVVPTCVSGNDADMPCLARRVASNSVVCVCNENYCDTITRVPPDRGTYNAYTSSEGGLRFSKSKGTLEEYDKTSISCRTTLELDPSRRYQTITGFGAAATDAAGINLKSLNETLQNKLIDSYFSKRGLEYNMIRVPIGGSDFSTHAYAYNELPENDTFLSNFSLSYEDHQYKIPMIKACMNASTADVYVVGTTWSPPRWMKTNHKYAGLSYLEPEFYQTYASYHYKFIEKYNEQGIRIWAITTTNEPSAGLLALNHFNTLGWFAKDLGKWIVNNLGPTIRNSSFHDVKILAADDQRLTLPYWVNYMIKTNPKTLEYIDGIAVHYYTDFVTPAAVLSEVSNAYPDKLILATEACEGSFPWEKDKVVLGSWQRAKNYIFDIITDLNHNVVGWIDWNMCLDAQGGPNWAKNYVDSPIIVFPKKKEFIKQPMYYAMGHFSKFVPRGSRRIGVTEKKCFFVASIEHIAFLTPNNTIVTVFYNSGGATTIVVKLGDKQAVLNVDANSITTVEMYFERKQRRTRFKCRG